MPSNPELSTAQHSSAQRPYTGDWRPLRSLCDTPPPRGSEQERAPGDAWPGRWESAALTLAAFNFDTISTMSRRCPFRPVCVSCWAHGPARDDAEYYSRPLLRPPFARTPLLAVTEPVLPSCRSSQCCQKSRQNLAKTQLCKVGCISSLPTSEKSFV